MPAGLLSPLMSLPGPLLQTLQTSYSYLATGAELLNDTLALDAHLRTAFYAEPADGGSDIWMHCHRMDLNEARKVFLDIRERKDKIADRYPLFADVAGLLDTTAHMAVNIIPQTELKPRRVAYVAADRKSFEIIEADKRGLPWSLAVHFGLSPEPMFGGLLDLEDSGVSRRLGSFGFGLYAYLGFSVIPALGAHQCISAPIAREWMRRRVTPPPLARGPDGTYFLDPR